MNATTYATLRKSIGSQKYVARLLGVHEQTISKRERGTHPISQETAAALEALRERLERGE